MIGCDQLNQAVDCAADGRHHGSTGATDQRRTADRGTTVRPRCLSCLMNANQLAPSSLPPSQMPSISR